MHVVPPYHWSQPLNSKIRTTNTELASHSPATLAQELGVPSGLAETSLLSHLWSSLTSTRNTERYGSLFGHRGE